MVLRSCCVSQLVRYYDQLDSWRQPVALLHHRFRTHESSCYHIAINQIGATQSPSRHHGDKSLHSSLAAAVWAVRNRAQRRVEATHDSSRVLSANQAPRALGYPAALVPFRPCLLSAHCTNIAPGKGVGKIAESTGGGACGVPRTWHGRSRN